MVSPLEILHLREGENLSPGDDYVWMFLLIHKAQLPCHSRTLVMLRKGPGSPETEADGGVRCHCLSKSWLLFCPRLCSLLNGNLKNKGGKTNPAKPEVHDSQKLIFKYIILA